MNTTESRPHTRAARLTLGGAVASLVLGAGMVSTTPVAAAHTESATTEAAFEAAQPEGLPAAEEIFERFIEAIGGREKVESIKNRRISGTFEGDAFEFRAILKIWWEHDGKYHQRVAEPAGLHYDLYAVDGYTWSEVMDREPDPLGGVQRQELLDTADFYGEANYKNRYKEFQTVREAKAGDTEIYVVRAVTPIGRPHTLFFAKDTGLLIGNRVPVTGPNNSLRDMTVRIEGYKEFGGVLYPTVFTQEFGNNVEPNKFMFTEMEVNVDDGHEYTVPDSIRKVFDAAKETEGKD